MDQRKARLHCQKPVIDLKDSAVPEGLSRCQSPNTDCFEGHKIGASTTQTPKGVVMLEPRKLKMSVFKFKPRLNEAKQFFNQDYFERDGGFVLDQRRKSEQVQRTNIHYLHSENPQPNVQTNTKGFVRDIKKKAPKLRVKKIRRDELEGPVLPRSKLQPHIHLQFA